ncbi:MAG TPA: SDR family oxidoreductase [Kofleriaceae bacterium]|nr:SDR family oxidoreductase [Kofleriaceae bacterium]
MIYDDEIDNHGSAAAAARAARDRRMPPRGRVVVVTGASGGLGRAIAVEFARQRSSLVLGARRTEALEDTARTCRAAGGEAIAVVTDVTREQDVIELAAAALDRWDRIDVWVNNAGVTLFALLEQAPFEQHQRVIETNLLGAMLGARVVLPVFRRQHHGVLINIGSVLSEIGQAFVPSYVISKFGVHGLSESLRVELADEPDIHVCTVFPYAIDTPHLQAAANRLGQVPRAMPPVSSPERIARAIARLPDHPRRRLYVPRIAVLGLALHAVIPRTLERLLLDALRAWHLGEQSEEISAGNLFEPGPETPGTHGSRPPLAGAARLLAWLAARMVHLEAEAAARLVRRARVWLQRARGGAAIVRASELPERV